MQQDEDFMELGDEGSMELDDEGGVVDQSMTNRGSHSNEDEQSVSGDGSYLYSPSGDEGSDDEDILPRNQAPRRGRRSAGGRRRTSAPSDGNDSPSNQTGMEPTRRARVWKDFSTPFLEKGHSHIKRPSAGRSLSVSYLRQDDNPLYRGAFPETKTKAEQSAILEVGVNFANTTILRKLAVDRPDLSITSATRQGMELFLDPLPGDVSRKTVAPISFGRAACNKDYVYKGFWFGIGPAYVTEGRYWIRKLAYDLMSVAVSIVASAMGVTTVDEFSASTTMYANAWQKGTFSTIWSAIALSNPLAHVNTNCLCRSGMYQHNNGICAYAHH